MTIRILQLFLVIILSLSFVSGCSVAMYTTAFQNAAASGQLRLGMTEQEVRGLLGPPYAVNTRQVKGGNGAVWYYRDRHYGPTITRDDEHTYDTYKAFTIATIGLAFPFLPPSPTTHYLVFNDGICVGWDMAASSDILVPPDKIIENRVREQQQEQVSFP